jgi:CBS domain-containing protein/sporulation protein YlmC with PRC-barrel domain
MSTATINGNVVPTKFNLSEILNMPAIARGERVGTLDELVIVDRDKYAEVTHLCIRRPFGRPVLVVPWEKVASLGEKQVVLDIEEMEPFAGAFPASAILLKDYILDKKVLDQRGGELEVVYDIGMTLTGNKLLVVDVDLSKAALLRRMRLAWLLKLLAKPSSSQGNGDRIPWRYVAPLPEDLGSFTGAVKLKVLKEQLSELPPVDLADILEELAPEQRMAIFGALDTARASDTLEALDPKVQRDVVASLDKETVARLINEMSPAQAADLLAVLPWWDVKALMHLLGDRERKAKLTAILEKQDEEAVHFSTSRFLKFSPEKTVAQVKAGFPEAAKGKVETTYLYVVDERDKLLGVVDSKALLLAEENARLDEIMTTKVIALGPQRTLRDASELFSRYLFRALPITDDGAKILGVLRYRDVVALRHRYIQ